MKFYNFIKILLSILICAFISAPAFADISTDAKTLQTDVGQWSELTTTDL